MSRSHTRAVALSQRRAVSAATRAGAFALPLLALLLATCESAFVTVADRVLNVAGATFLLP